MLTKRHKDNIIEKFKTHKKDTGSPEVQCAILTSEVEDLVEHLKTHRKDHSSRRGLLGKINQRKKLLMYLQQDDEKRHASLVKKLGLKK